MKSYGKILWKKRVFHDVYEIARVPLIDDDKGQNTNLYQKAGIAKRVQCMIDVPVELLPNRIGMTPDELVTRCRFAFTRWLDRVIESNYDNQNGEYEYAITSMHVNEMPWGELQGMSWVLTVELNMTVSLYFKLSKSA